MQDLLHRRAFLALAGIAPKVVGGHDTSIFSGFGPATTRSQVYQMGMTTAPRISSQRHNILLAVHHTESPEQVAFLARSHQTRPQIAASPARKNLRGTQQPLLDCLLLIKGIQVAYQILGGLARLYIYDNQSFILFTLTR